jgi:CubicO group peptidase (beta-lactamase class C family)
MKRITFFILVVWATCVAIAAQGDVASFDKYVERARSEWNVPGLSVAVVRDGTTLLLKGYGVRELGGQEPVDARTLFGAMSTTKAMTAVAMAILLDEGKIDLDERVVNYLPDFRIADPYITQELKVRDLFTHNSGLPSTDFLWSRTPELPENEAVQRMRLARPAYSFRGGFIYQNSMYLVAGKVIEKVSGMPWDRFMTERVFRPLGMNSTVPTLAAAASVPNRSAAHYLINGRIEKIPEMPIDSVGPAGSVWSNADDMAKWISFLMTGRSADGRQILKPATLNELFKPQVILPSTFFPTFQLTKPNFTTYAYGWFQHDYRGEKIDFHTGSIAGRIALIGLIRSKKLGIYVFGNLDHAEARHALMYKAFDLFGFGDDSRDWHAEVKKLYDGIAADNERRAAAARSSRLPDTRPSRPLELYTGTYTDPFYGTVTISVENGKLRAAVARDLTAELVHRHLDTFTLFWSRPWMGESLVTFQLSPMNGEVVGLTAANQTFRKQPSAPAR